MNAKDYVKIAEIIGNKFEELISLRKRAVEEIPFDKDYEEDVIRYNAQIELLRTIIISLAEYFEELEKKENDITGLGNLKIKEQFTKACGVNSE